MRLLCMGVPSKMVRLGLTQIDLIIQIYYFLCGFRDFCEKLLFLSQTAQASQKGEFAKQDAMSCEACDAEPTEARHLARGERQRNPG